jgi:hypothetical protein
MSERYPVIRVRSEYDGQVEVRDGVILCFFMRRAQRDIAPVVWRALQTYLRAIPPESLAWYIDDEGDTLPLDAAGWEYIRTNVLERPWAGACRVQLWERESEVGGYNFEYAGLQIDDPLWARDERPTCGIAFSFPTEYLLEQGPAHLRALALELARELPFSFGDASLAYVAPSGRWYTVRRQLLPMLSRYLGLDLYHLEHTGRVIGTRARGAYWLTFLGQPLFGQLGGLDALRQQLPFPDVTFEELDGERALLTLGEWPVPIDTREPFDVSSLHTLACLLEPYLCEETIGLTTLFDTHTMNRWLRRLCQHFKLPLTDSKPGQ